MSAGCHYQGLRVICVSDFPRSIFLLLSSPPTISPKNGAINIVVTLSCGVFLVRLRGVDTWPLKEHSIGVPKRSPLEGLGIYYIYMYIYMICTQLHSNIRTLKYTHRYIFYIDYRPGHLIRRDQSAYDSSKSGIFLK